MISDDQKEDLIIECLSSDEKIIPIIMKILDKERSSKKEIVRELNNLVSKAEAALGTPRLNKEGFIQKEINDFFKKHEETKGVFHAYKEQ